VRLVPSPDRALVRKVLIVLGLGAAGLAIWMLRFVILLMFGAVVWAVLLRSLSEPLAQRTRLSDRVALALVIGLLIAALALVGVFFGLSLQSQFVQAATLLPQAAHGAIGWIRTLPFGGQLLQALGSVHLQDIGPALMHVPGYAIAGVTAAADLLIVMASGVYLALQPQLYRENFLRFAPLDARPRLRLLLQDSETLLRKWLLAQLVAMATVGLLVGVGMRLIGAPAPAALGLFAGVVEFIPFAGPVLSAVPALLLASVHGIDKAGWTLLLFFVIQHFEGDLLLPLLQRRMVRLPPAISLFALLIFGVLFGVLGVVLAAPLTVVAIAVLRALDRPPSA
jgi:predicted PurR-regulated permease PerM